MIFKPKERPWANRGQEMEEVRSAEIVERVVTTVELCLSVKRNRRQTACENDFHPFCVSMVDNYSWFVFIILEKEAERVQDSSAAVSTISAKRFLFESSSFWNLSSPCRPS